MKLTALILFVTTAMAFQAHHLHENHARAMLMDRAMDPSTMDPALLALLKAIKTVIPSGTDVPLPTGTSEPDWYKGLPDDIKSSLCKYYPATTTSSSSSSTSTSSSTSSSTPQATSTVVQSSSQASSSVVSTSMPAITSTPSFNITSMSSTSFSGSSTASLSSVSGLPSPSGNQSTIAITPALTATPPSATISAGLRNAAHMNLLTTTVAWLTVAAGFCLLA